MTGPEFRKLMEEEATFPSVAAGGYPWRTFTPALQAPPKNKPTRKPKATKKTTKKPTRSRKKSPTA